MNVPLPLASTEETPSGAPSRVLLATGFRPFFLLAALWAVLGVPLWVVVLRGGATSWMDPVLWHAHEMIYGFAVAVIAGFLLTAVRHWTGGEPTAAGGGLLLLAALWLAGRVTLLPGLGVPDIVAVPINLAFLPALAVAVGRPIVRTRNTRNYKVLAVLTALWLVQAAVFAHAAGGWLTPDTAHHLLRVALLVVVTLCLLISGRIVPLFTRNATGQTSLRNWPAADTAAFSGAAILILSELAGVTHPIVSAVAAVTGVAVLGRMRWWGTPATLRDPLLWVLHLGHAWIGIGFLLRSGDLVAPLAWQSAWTHALALGGIGTLILGMMARVALGHTGRALKAPRITTAAFVLLTLGVVLRVFTPLIAPALIMRSIEASAILWSASFLLYLVAHTHMLVTPRPDGKPG